MKKIFTSFCTVLLLSFYQNVSAQCQLKDVVITIKTTQQNGANCSTTFDFSFMLNNNNGNKTVVIQAWPESDYPNYWGAQCDNNKAPRAADLRKTTSPYSPSSPGPLPFLNLAFDITSKAPINSTYYPGGGVTLASGYTVEVGPLDAQGFFPVTLKNLSVTIPNQNCSEGVTIRTDVWSSQAAITSSWTPHCVLCNNRFAFNYPQVNASLNCLVPRQYSVIIRNINTSQTITCSWKTYRDDNENGVYDVATDPIVDDQSTNMQTITPGGVFNSGPLSYNGNNTPPAINKSLLVVVTTVGIADKKVALAANGCAPLPVEFRSFTASRNQSNVLVKWETVAEYHSKGFVLERNTGEGWKEVVDIPSQALGGNSEVLLSYSYTDFNNLKGVSQYRIRQVDLDGRSRYSEIRAVKGEGMNGKTIVYPTPSNDGRVNVVFEEGKKTRNLSLFDMSGRLVHRLNGVNSNLIQIDNLLPGIYSLQIYDLESRQLSMEKVIVNRR